MPYGCCVGNIACLSYAEPITQAVISSKHKSGLTGQETTGMARINELIDARTTEDFNFNIELKDKYVYTKNGKENSIKIQKIINNLNLIAKKRGQSLSQLALAWVLNNKAVTSALIGVRSVAQLKDNLAALNNLKFTKDELKKIDKNAKEGNINLWAPSSSYWKEF